MAQWVRIGRGNEMPAEGSVREVLAGGLALCVARIGGVLSAVNNACPHRGAPLSEGMVEEGRIVCPWHGWSFDPQTGAELTNPQCGTTAYRVRVDDDDVWCEV